MPPSPLSRVTPASGSVCCYDGSLENTQAVWGGTSQRRSLCFVKDNQSGQFKKQQQHKLLILSVTIEKRISLNYVSSRAAGNAKPCLFVCSFVCLFVLESTGREWTGDRASAGRLSWPLLVGLGFCFSMTQATAVQSGRRIKGKD